MVEPDIEISNEDTKVQLFKYDDEGNVNSEVIITANGREFVIVDNERAEYPEVYERKPGDTRPFKKWAPEEKRLPQE